MANKVEANLRLPRFARLFMILLVVCVGILAAMYVTGLTSISMYSGLRELPIPIRAIPQPRSQGPVLPSITLISPRKDDIRVGDFLHYRITSAYHTNGTGRESGGDFWSATLASESNPRASTTGHFVDHGNGTYSVYFYAGWAGNVTVSVTRVLSSEAVDFMKNVIWPAEDRVVWQGYFKTLDTEDFSVMPRGLCKLRSQGTWTGVCEYPHPKALGKTVFMCEKPPTVASCDTLYALKSDGQKISARFRELVLGRQEIYQGYSNPVRIAEQAITIIDTAQPVKRLTLPKCLPDQELPPSHGYWVEGQWHSLICDITDWTEGSKLKLCIRNKNLILLGDSTTRQWFMEIHDLLGIGLERKPEDRMFTLRRHYDRLNATIFYTAHPQLVGRLTVYLHEVHYEVDILDDLSDPQCNYIVMISPWAHFSQWTRASYIDRTERLRDALLRFRNKCPGVKVILKGPHARDHKNFESTVFCSDYILKEIEKINRRTLQGIGVWYLPVWEMNSAYPAPNTIHMPRDVIREELRMFFSYVCS